MVEAPSPNPTGTSKTKWYHRLWFVVFMLLTIGPFAFPLLWKSNDFGIKTKWTLTIFFILMTIAAIWGSVETVKIAIRYFKELQETLNV